MTADGDIEVLVRDDGSGFDLEADSGGFGLLGMRERLVLVHGTLAIESAPGAGTTVRARIPSRRRGRPDGDEVLPAARSRPADQPVRSASTEHGARCASRSLTLPSAATPRLPALPTTTRPAPASSAVPAMACTGEPKSVT